MSRNPRKRRQAAPPRHATRPAAGPPSAGAAGAAGAPDGNGSGASGAARIWRRNRREITFLALFVVLLGGSFTLISANWVNDHAIEPFTGGIASVSGAILNLAGQHVALRGTVIQGPHFAVNIRNGCNGIEAVLIFLAAVLAFPAPWRWRLGGLVLGILAIQVVNLLRVVSLYLTGAYLPRLFDASHTVIWQSVVILFGVLLWIFWATRLPPQDEPAT
ncbi:MAG: exosortase H [Acidobacteria bacterium]|nr:exosortase H [Acidobacteriota bacterium]